MLQDFLFVKHHSLFRILSYITNLVKNRSGDGVRTCTRTGMGCHLNHGVYLPLDSRVICLSFSLFCPPGSQEDSDCCLHSDSMCLHKACSEPTASPVCCLFHADDLPFTARDSCVESQHGLSKKGFPVHYQKHVGHVGNAHPHSQTFKLILLTALASNSSSPKRKSHLCLTQSSFAISVIGVTPVSHDC